MADATEISLLNERIATHLAAHVPNVEIRFDAPNAEEPPTSPTLHLFMYLIREDLSIRQSLQSGFNPQTGSHDIPYARIRCLYLITYWDNSTNDGSSPDAQPSSQTTTNLTETMRALLCMRRHTDFKDYQFRVIEPEALNSLGNFWQALGNKPRAIINFAVTLPVSIEHPAEGPQTGTPILETYTVAVQQRGNLLVALEAVLFERLRVALSSSTTKNQLTKVTIKAASLPSPEDQSVFNTQVIVSGITYQATVDALEDVIASWKGESLTLDNKTVVLQEVTNELAAVATPTQNT